MERSTLRLSLQHNEGWDDERECFQSFGGCDVELEHSLYTVSIFERKKHMAFSDMDLTSKKDLIFYISECMCITPNIPKDAWLALTNKQLIDVSKFMEDPYCSTTVKPRKKKSRHNRKVTAEVTYASMFSFGLPLELEHWHYNRLITLLAVCADLQSPPEKMSKQEIFRQQQEQNERMRALYNSKG